MPMQSVASHVRRAIGLSAARVTRVDQMQFVLPDLRAADSGFMAELVDGRLPLVGGAIRIGTKGAFDGPIDNDTLRRELFSLAWLRHLHATRSADAEDLARRHLLAWSRSTARRSALAAEPAVMARRVMSLLAHVDIALSGATAADFDRLMDLVADEVAMLREATVRMPLALPRLTGLIALAAFHVCSASLDGTAQRDAERRLSANLVRQILPDGGHLSRNPAALLEVALDLVPLQRAYVSAHQPVPAAIPAALHRLAGMLALLSHGDRQLGRFNGAGATALTEIAMALKTLPSTAMAGTTFAKDTGYVRLQNGNSVILFDAGPGAETLAGEAPFAGALSFELSAGRAPLIVNGGSDHQPFALPRVDVRATGNHSTLVLGTASSAPPTGARGGSTRCTLEAEPGDTTPTTIRASSDGYRARFGFNHNRTVALLRDGWLVDGVDELVPASADTAAVPFSIRFHLHPTVHVHADAAQQSLRLTAADGSRWSMTVGDGVTPVIEPSTFHAGASGPRPTLQIVLRGEAVGTTRATWRIERMSPSAVS